MNNNNLYTHHTTVTRQQRAHIKAQKPCVLWFTGLSASGKSTIANELEHKLVAHGCHTMLLDGDNVRKRLNYDLGFSDTDRHENIRRIGEVAKLMAEAGLIVLTAFISPFRNDRAMVRSLLPEGEFCEIHLAASLATCEARDPKGLYRKSRQGEIPAFTGISSPYEEPLHPEIRLDTGVLSIDECVDAVMNYLRSHAIVAIS